LEQLVRDNHPIQVERVTEFPGHLLDLHDGVSEGKKIGLDLVGYWGSGGLPPWGIHKSTDFIDDFFASPRLSIQESVAREREALFERLVDLALDQVRDHQQRVFNIKSRRVTPSRFG
jgi:hypothetical protein